MTGYCIVHTGNVGLFIPGGEAARLAAALRREITGPDYLPDQVDPPSNASVARAEIAALVHKLDTIAADHDRGRAADDALAHAPEAARAVPADAGGERQ